MCGRFAQFSIKDFYNIQDEFGIDEKDEPEDLPFNYNAAPGQKIYALVKDEKRRLKGFHWGLLTNWSAKDPHFKLINVRSETLSEKKTFAHYFKQNRCLVIADGFYEWDKEGKTKVPYYIYMKDRKPFAIAGLWNDYLSPDGKTTPTGTLLTSTSNTLVGRIHDRMPVILPKERYADWLDNGNFDRDKLLGFLSPYPAEKMAMHEVSADVNSVKNNRADLIEPAVQVRDVLFPEGK
jgi:putative SOS response-associated peptidase YedK